jgi:hypothetical protein
MFAADPQMDDNLTVLQAYSCCSIERKYNICRTNIDYLERCRWEADPLSPTSQLNCEFLSF